MRNRTPDWPFDVDLVIQKMGLRRSKPRKAMALLARVMQEFGFKAEHRKLTVSKTIFGQGEDGEPTGRLLGRLSYEWHVLSWGELFLTIDLQRCEKELVLHVAHEPVKPPLASLSPGILEDAMVMVGADLIHPGDGLFANPLEVDRGQLVEACEWARLAGLKPFDEQPCPENQLPIEQRLASHAFQYGLGIAPFLALLWGTAGYKNGVHRVETITPEGGGWMVTASVRMRRDGGEDWWVGLPPGNEGLVWYNKAPEDFRNGQREVPVEAATAPGWNDPFIQEMARSIVAGHLRDMLPGVGVVARARM